MKKTIIVSVLCLLMMACVIEPLSATTVPMTTPQPYPLGNTLYVGGSGPNNYTKIQDAIDDAIAGDTVFVYNDSSPYQETVIVNKSISLVGEDKATTVIQGIDENSTVVTISADNVSVNDFTILTLPSSGWNCGIWISKMKAWPGETKSIRDIHIFDNIIEAASNISSGIATLYLNQGNISKNHLNCGYFGIQLFLSSGNTVTQNVIEQSMFGIYVSNTWNPRYHLWFTHPQFGGNILSRNTVRYNQIGILIDGDRTTNDKVLENNITDNTLGIALCTSRKTEIARNNFIGNNRSALIITMNLLSFPTSSWHDNYWDRPRNLPMPIFGRFWFVIMYNTAFGETNFGNVLSLGTYPVFAFDTTPAQEPYDIPSGV